MNKFQAMRDVVHRDKLVAKEQPDDVDLLLERRIRGPGGTLADAVVHGGREPLLDAAKVRRLVPNMLTNQWRALMPVEDEIIAEQLKTVEATLDRYKQTVLRFRSEVKNDIASIKSAASATEDTVNRIGKAYMGTARMLTTPEFERAIQNAERMATALKAIADLQSHSITFAVLDRKPSQAD